MLPPRRVPHHPHQFETVCEAVDLTARPGVRGRPAADGLGEALRQASLGDLYMHLLLAQLHLDRDPLSSAVALARCLEGR